VGEKHLNGCKFKVSSQIVTQNSTKRVGLSHRFEKFWTFYTVSRWSGRRGTDIFKFGNKRGNGPLKGFIMGAILSSAPLGA
jgi:hypothetical protein